MKILLCLLFWFILLPVGAKPIEPEKKIFIQNQDEPEPVFIAVIGEPEVLRTLQVYERGFVVCTAADLPEFSDKFKNKNYLPKFLPIPCKLKDLQPLTNTTYKLPEFLPKIAYNDNYHIFESRFKQCQKEFFRKTTYKKLRRTPKKE